MTPLEIELRDIIIETCDVDRDLIDRITSASNIIGDDSTFGLDSLDALELVDAFQKRYDVRFDSQKSARVVLKNLETLAKFIQEERKT